MIKNFKIIALSALLVTSQAFSADSVARKDTKSLSFSDFYTLAGGLASILRIHGAIDFNNNKKIVSFMSKNNVFKKAGTLVAVGALGAAIGSDIENPRNKALNTKMFLIGAGLGAFGGGCWYSGSALGLAAGRKAAGMANFGRVGTVSLELTGLIGGGIAVAEAGVKAADMAICKALNK